MTVRINRMKDLERSSRLAARKRDERVAKIAQAKMDALAADTQLGQDKLRLTRRIHDDTLNQNQLQRLATQALQDDQQAFLSSESGLNRNFKQNESALNRINQQNLQQDRLNSASDLQARRLNYAGNQADLNRIQQTNERIAGQNFTSAENRAGWLRQMHTPRYMMSHVDPTTGQIVKPTNVNPLAQVPKEDRTGVFDGSDEEFFTGKKRVTLEANKKKKKIAPPTNLEVYSGLQSMKNFANKQVEEGKFLYNNTVRPALKWLSSPY